MVCMNRALDMWGETLQRCTSSSCMRRKICAFEQISEAKEPDGVSPKRGKNDRKTIIQTEIFSIRWHGWEGRSLLLLYTSKPPEGAAIHWLKLTVAVFQWLDLIFALKRCRGNSLHLHVPRAVHFLRKTSMYNNSELLKFVIWINTLNTEITYRRALSQFVKEAPDHHTHSQYVPPLWCPLQAPSPFPTLCIDKRLPFGLGHPR